MNGPHQAPDLLARILGHPLTIILCAFLIAWKGYRFGQWSHAAVH